MQQNQLKTKKRTKKRIGRGGKRGTYSGRGVKGQKCRAGRKMQPMIREVIKRYPKLRGYKLNPKDKNEIILDLSVLEKNFESGEKVSPQSLLKKKIIRKIKGKIPKVKVLAQGELKKSLEFENISFSKKAEKICIQSSKK